MSYAVIKGVTLLEAQGKEINEEVFLPLEAFWDDHTILNNQRIIFIDSPISGLEVGLLITSHKESDPCPIVKEILEGAGCKVTILEANKDIPSNLNLVLQLNPAEGVFQTAYGGYIFNGSRRLAADIGWAMAKVFELDYIMPPHKERKIQSKISFWDKITVPLISIKWRSSKGSELFLAVSILLGLFRFASSKLPLIDEKIFLDVRAETDQSIDSILFESSNLVRSTLLKPVNPAVIEEKESSSVDFSKEVDEEVKKQKIPKKKQGKMVTNPSPKLEAYMKKIIAEQNAKSLKESKTPNKIGHGKVAPEEIYKKAGLGKG